MSILQFNSTLFSNKVLVNRANKKLPNKLINNVGKGKISFVKKVTHIKSLNIAPNAPAKPTKM